eukprot:CAMPEP_0114503804 /NCGR_PEP_ID=MMETSP0109-20121206/9850_1 /TAXON_ID=29199 /ORGANISM="Chlorarachnion reptans, Strain CCCM449" /LENGTH=456 /DNA_ID=CAMNT_0001681871 /DNA_START=128 /DNA_END=1498 /DNA_ORIENTATION=+
MEGDGIRAAAAASTPVDVAERSKTSGGRFLATKTPLPLADGKASRRPGEKQRHDRKRMHASKNAGCSTVLLRIKRKRDETPKEALLIATEASKKSSKRPMVKAVRQMLSAVSLSPASQPSGGKKSQDETGRGSTKLFKLVDTISEADMGSKRFEKRLLVKLKKEKARSGLKVAPLSMRERRIASRAEHNRRFVHMTRYRILAKNKQETKANESIESLRGSEDFKWFDLEKSITGPSLERVNPKQAASSSTPSSSGSRLDAVNQKFSTVFKGKPSNVSSFFNPPKHINSHISTTDASDISSSKAHMDAEDSGYVYDLYCISTSQDISWKAKPLEADKYAFIDMRGMAVPEELLQDDYNSEEDDFEGLDDEEQGEIDYPDEGDWDNFLDVEDRRRDNRDDGYRGESSSSDLVTDQLWIPEPSCNLGFSSRAVKSGRTSISDLKRSLRQQSSSMRDEEL